jgi:2-(1,2-epoxy-1,2-dihydrophenyl)acetyl-CoA isomerase
MTRMRTLEVVTSPAVDFDCRNGVAVVTLARPETRNALSAELLAGLAKALEQASAAGARALVLTGEGRIFCAGGDLTGVSEALLGDVTTNVGALVDQLHEVISMLRSMSMPTVAAVNGAAIGAGVSLALACDVRIIATSTTFMTGYLAVGASPDGGASFHLAKALGGPQALSSFLTNRRLTSAELRACGLADDLVEDGELLVRATAQARVLAELSFPAVLAVRDLVHRACGRTFEQQLDAEKQHFLAVAHTREFRDAMAPFARRSAALKH